MDSPVVAGPLDLEAWREFAKRGEDAPEVTLHKEFVPYSIKAGAEGSRQLTFTISTGVSDRASDTIRVDGWQLDAYRKNPVVLWAHDSSLLPIARTVSIGARAGALVATAEFTPPELNPLGAQVYDLIKAGFLNAVSVGFRPVGKDSWKFNASGGIDFLTTELMEFSVVGIPCNPEALVDAKAAGLTSEIEKWAKAWAGMSETPATIAHADPLSITTNEFVSAALTTGRVDATVLEKAGRRHSAATMAALNAAHKAAEDCTKAAGDCMSTLKGLLEPDDMGPDSDPEPDPEDPMECAAPAQEVVLKLRPAEVPRPRLTAEEVRRAVVDAVNEVVASVIRRATGRLD